MERLDLLVLRAPPCDIPEKRKGESSLGMRRWDGARKPRSAQLDTRAKSIESKAEDCASTLGVILQERARPQQRMER